MSKPHFRDIVHTWYLWANFQKIKFLGFSSGFLGIVGLYFRIIDICLLFIILNDNLYIFSQFHLNVLINIDFIKD